MPSGVPNSVVNYFSCLKTIILRGIVTCYEKLIYLNNPDVQKQWLDKGQLPVPVAKRERFEKKGSPLRLLELRRSYIL
jgi:hypothetical protein